jgi:trigger factor
MQVSLETTQGLERRMTVSVPAERIENEVQNRLKNLAQTVRLKGFRPGKVPFKVMENRYGSSVRKDVVDDITRRTFYEAVSRENIQLAGLPRFQPRVVEPGKNLEYEAVFEIMANVKLASLGHVSIAKPVAEITEQDIDAMLNNLRRQRAEWIPVDRPAQAGDRLIVAGTIDGQPFLGEQEKPVILGSNVFKELEDALIGVKAGDERSLDLRFPKDYPAAVMADKQAHFDLKVHSVAESKLPDVDVDFIRSFDMKESTLETFRQELRKTMQDEMDDVIRGKIKQQVLDALYRENPLEAPVVQVEQQTEFLLAQAQQTLKNQGVPESEIKLDRASFEKEARRRVVLGLLVAEIVKQQRMSADPQRVRARVESLASSFENPSEAIQWYYADRNRLANVEQLVLEDLVVDWIMGQVQVKEERTSFEALLKERRAA